VRARTFLDYILLKLTQMIHIDFSVHFVHFRPLVDADQSLREARTWGSDTKCWRSNVGRHLYVKSPGYRNVPIQESRSHNGGFGIS
jgi:hypothetical protein